MKIHVGITDGSLTEVTDGELAPGDALVTEVTGLESDNKPPSTTPPGAPQPGGGLRRVF